jgi:hypothetical protein
MNSEPNPNAQTPVGKVRHDAGVRPEAVLFAEVARM